MKINKTKAMAIAFACVIVLSLFGATIVSAPKPDDIPPDNSNSLLALVQEIKVELEAAGIDASNASLYGEQIWQLTGNTHSWATIRDAIDDIKDEVEAAGVDASNSEFYARAIWELAGNSHGWVCIRDAIDEIKNAVDSVGLVIDEIKDEVDAIGPDAESASINSEQVWELTGNSHDWVCIRDALDDIKNEIEDVVPDAYDASLYSEQAWMLTGNSHDWANIRDALDDMKNQLNSIENQVANSMQLLAYYEDVFYYWGDSEGFVPGTEIVTNKPVLFTVAYNVFNINGGSYGIELDSDPYISIDVFWTDDMVKRGLFTFSGAEMSFHYDVGSAYGLRITWSIMVQGTPGTIVTVVNPP